MVGNWFVCRWRNVGTEAEPEWLNGAQAKYPGMKFLFGEDGGVDPSDGSPVPKFTILKLSYADSLLVKGDLDLFRLPNPDPAKTINQLLPADWKAFYEPVQALGIDLGTFPATATMADITNYIGCLVQLAFDISKYP